MLASAFGDFCSLVDRRRALAWAGSWRFPARRALGPACQRVPLTEPRRRAAAGDGHNPVAKRSFAFRNIPGFDVSCSRARVPKAQWL